MIFTFTNTFNTVDFGKKGVCTHLHTVSHRVYRSHHYGAFHRVQISFQFNRNLKYFLDVEYLLAVSLNHHFYIITVEIFDEFSPNFSLYWNKQCNGENPKYEELFF